MRLITSGNELLDNAAEGWGSYSQPSGQPAGTCPINGTGGNDAFGYFSSTLNQGPGRLTPQKNGGRGYFLLKSGFGMARKLIDPAAPEGAPITRTELYGHVAVHGFANTGGERTILHLMDAASNIIASISMYDAGQPNTGIRLSKGDLYNGGASVITSSASNFFDRNTWTSIEWHIKMDAVNGIFEMRVNGGPIQTFVGDVRGPTGQVDIAAVWHVHRTTNNTTDTGEDDIVVNDVNGTTNNSWTGQTFVVMLQPGRDGTLIGGGNQLTNQKGDKVSNFDSVRLQPPFPGWGVGVDRMRGYEQQHQFGASQNGIPSINFFSASSSQPEASVHQNNGAGDYARNFVFPTADGQKDSYKLPGDVPLEFSTVGAVCVMSRCMSKDKTFSKIRHLIEGAGPVEVLGPLRTLPRDNVDWIHTHFEKNPSNTPWTLADLNAIEFGAKFNT
jgi:hypothetical protein